MYANLLDFEKTLSMPEAHRTGQSVRNSVIYAHYCRTRTLEPILLRLADTVQDRHQFMDSLHRAKTISGDGDEWTLIYVGLAAALESGRTPSTRFDHEFNLTRYFRQAPALESLFLLLRKSFGWTTRCSNGHSVARRNELNIRFDHGRSEFLNWCESHVRCSWVERPDYPRTRKECAALLGTDETALIKAWNPLLNVVKNRTNNAFCVWLTKEREQFHREHWPRE